MGNRSILDRLVELDNKVHSAMPGKDIYSKLFFRTILWFAFFFGVYLIVSNAF
ncbi:MULTISPECIES: hypothetical protein [Natronorubrum]|uniref:Uncharacterized protein n=2 Tax=Natronorubrum TaxID=134813 RepID=A0A1N7ETA9_9EURY|nr:MULTISPECIES: hypothetical protein [Natronorubrum]SEH13537.1 hypothetical protein SAMN04487967_1436 [Natronorubrum sediminis]SIR91254.1 hypothetical protein SAMN05421809_2849 [Natronorubrum daqingense]